MNKHYLIRPPVNATEVHKWTGKEWIPDDGKPGLAFSTGQQMSYYPYCDCHAFNDKCPGNVANTYTFKRFGCSNGRPTPSDKMLQAIERRELKKERNHETKIAKEKLDISRKDALENWFQEINIPVTLNLTNVEYCKCQLKSTLRIPVRGNR